MIRFGDDLNPNQSYMLHKKMVWRRYELLKRSNVVTSPIKIMNQLRNHLSIQTDHFQFDSIKKNF